LASVPELRCAVWKPAPVKVKSGYSGPAIAFPLFWIRVTTALMSFELTLCGMQVFIAAMYDMLFDCLLLYC